MAETFNFYMDGNLKSNLKMAKSVIKKDWDMVFVIDGSEGSGKSVLAMQSAKFCDPTFSVERVAFTANEFREAVINAAQYQAVVFDEAYRGLNSRAAMSMVNRILIQMLAEIRQKNLFVFVVMPCFFDLDKYVALWRSRALVHVYVGDNFERGFFLFFNQERKKQLYINGKKFYTYSKPKANFFGRFTNHYPIDEQDYRKKKKDSLTNSEGQMTQKLLSSQLINEMVKKLAERDGMTNQEKAELIGVPISTYYYKLRQYNEGNL